MKKLIIMSNIAAISMFGFSKEIPVSIYHNGTNINFNVDGGTIQVESKGNIVVKDYDRIDIRETEPTHDDCYTAYCIILQSENRYCELIINCQASDKRKINYDDIIEQLIENDESKKRFTTEAIVDYFKKTICLLEYRKGK